MFVVGGLRFVVVVDGCNLLWVGGRWSTGLLWVAGVGVGDSGVVCEGSFVVWFGADGKKNN